MSRIKVLVVDDSAMVRQFLTTILNEDDGIEVVGTAIDPIFAMQKIMRQPPDVITLDVEMPRMNGLTFLQKLMKSYPIPAVMISAWTKKGCDTTLRALELGAVDFIAKPDVSRPESLSVLKTEIIAKVKNAARVNLKAAEKNLTLKHLDDSNTKPEQHHIAVSQHIRKKVIAIGASTGGVVAVRSVIDKLQPAGFCILIALHMPSGFTEAFAERLGSINGWNSYEAIDGMTVSPRSIYVAPGGHNMMIEGRNNAWTIKVKVCEATDVFKPNINKTFASVARNVGAESIGVIMTGMGDDGAKGLLMMKKAGAVTISQSPETCMVYGMPRKAVECGAVDYIVPLDQIAAKLKHLI